METDIVTGLETGADDYMTKPFSLMVLRARVNAVFRRKQERAGGFRQDGFFFDFESMVFTVEGNAVELSKTEQKLLKILVSNCGNIVSRDMLIDRIWSDGAEFVEENALSVTMNRLRSKLPGAPVKTIYGIGYMWEKNFLMAALVLLAAALVFLYMKSNRMWNSVERMVEAARDGIFVETAFDEGRLSRLESKMYQYLVSGQTSRRQTEREREKIKALVSDISHQTKTPIANMMLYTQLLEENGSLDGNARSIAFQIEEQVNKLNFLIQSLVKLSRLESGMLEVRPEKNKIRKLIAGLDYAAAAEQKGISLSVGEVPELTAFFDLKWTLEALSNIVDNAIKYTPAGGSVAISVKEYEMFARIDIEDTGIGMEEEETAKIFARFYRSPAVSGESGVGIGLYLVREILGREGGYVKVASRPGKGSVFSVFLGRI